MNLYSVKPRDHRIDTIDQGGLGDLRAVGGVDSCFLGRDELITWNVLETLEAGTKS